PALPPAAKVENYRLAAAEAKKHWDSLASADATKAYEAICALARAPEDALPLFDKSLKPVTRVEPKRVAEMLNALGSERVAERDRATKELEDLAEGAELFLRVALKKPASLEIQQRLDKLLDRLDPLQSPARLQALRAVETLEWMGTPEARKMVERLAEGMP